MIQVYLSNSALVSSLLLKRSPFELMVLTHRSSLSPTVHVRNVQLIPIKLIASYCNEAINQIRSRASCEEIYPLEIVGIEVKAGWIGKSNRASLTQNQGR